MNRNLLIVGAGTYGVVASEIASDMGSFDKIDFIDDERKTTPNGIEVVGTTSDIAELAARYGHIIVAIGNPKIRLSLLRKIKEETPYRIVSLVSPRAYVSPSAQVQIGCIVEPMAVVHTSCVLCPGCLISAGAVVNHATMCCEGVHVDCNATVEGYCLVQAGTKIHSGSVYKKTDAVKAEDLSVDPSAQGDTNTDIAKRRPKEIDGLEYTFESGM